MFPENVTPQESWRAILLRKAYEAAPFPILGDLKTTTSKYQADLISCLICSARSSESLLPLLNDLAAQSIDGNHLEVLIGDHSPAGHDALARQFRSRITLRLFRDTSTHGLIGRMKNILLENATGAVILFLDDDTRLPQNDFLSKGLIALGKTDSGIVLPHGHGISHADRPHYDYLDPYSFANRCCLFQRAILDRLGGFRQDITAYEDIDLGIRATLAGIKATTNSSLHYRHPALLFRSMQKPLAIGQSVLLLRKHYPLGIWLMIYINALRLLANGLFPTTPNRQWFKIGLGVLLAGLVKGKKTY